MKRTPNKPTREELQAAYGKTIPDRVSNSLQVLFVGINPSLYSAAVGRHFARPGNRFWPALFESGFTPRLFSPFDDHLLPEDGCGLTNLVAKATARADELSPEALARGARSLKRKIKRLKPRFAAFVGVTAYRTGFSQPKAQIGRQHEQIGETIVWVLPNPSGLNAHYQREDFARLFRELRAATDESTDIV